MRYVHTAAVTSHAALTCSPRDSARYPNAPAPTIAIKSHPSHESNLPMRVPSLGVTLPPNWPAARTESTARCRPLSGLVSFALLFADCDCLNSPTHSPRARRELFAPGP